jgi:hypothetical protein
MFLFGFWAYLQRAYIMLLPPTHFHFLKTLNAAPFHRATFVVSQYSAPVAAYADQWAYYDPAISKGEVQLTESGYVVQRDTTTYLWLADRAVNADYLKPEYYACMIPQSIETVINRLNPNVGVGVGSHCTEQGIMRLTRSTDWRPLGHQVVAADVPGQDFWAILKLDWEFPPYLKPLDPEDMTVEVASNVDPDGTRLSVRYEYAQQDGRTEKGSLTRLYRVSSDGQPACLIAESASGDALRLPADFAGFVRVSVIPGSTTKFGREYFSDVIVIGSSRDLTGNCGSGRA